MGSAISWEIVCVRGMHYMSEACMAAASSISHISSYRRATPQSFLLAVAPLILILIRHRHLDGTVASTSLPGSGFRACDT